MCGFPSPGPRPPAPRGGGAQKPTTSLQCLPLSKTDSGIYGVLNLKTRARCSYVSDGNLILERELLIFWPSQPLAPESPARGPGPRLAVVQAHALCLCRRPGWKFGSHWEFNEGVESREGTKAILRKGDRKANSSLISL